MLVRAQEERARARALRRVNATVEPGVLASAMLRPEDDAIRAADLPEREQLRAAPAPELPDHDACARSGNCPVCHPEQAAGCTLHPRPSCPTTTRARG